MILNRSRGKRRTEIILCSAVIVAVSWLTPAVNAQVIDCTGQLDGTSCDDGNGCDGADTCTAGGCAGTMIVDDGVQLTRLAPGDPTVVISWNPAPGATGSDVVRGMVSALPASPTDAGETLLVRNTGSANYQDSTVPAPGAAFWYLVRGRTSCGGGPWGFQTTNGVASVERQPREGCVVNVNASPRYVDHGLTVTDLQTCLEWEKKSQSGESIHLVGYTSNWFTANGSWLSTVNAENFAGHSDWRVPTSAGQGGFPTGQPAELESIVDRVYFPSIDPIFGPTASDSYWSSSTYAAYPYDAWFLGFAGGSLYAATKYTPHYVRAVRGGP
jgi:hypothetical protein